MTNYNINELAKLLQSSKKIINKDEFDSIDTLNPLERNVEVDLTPGDFISGDTVFLLCAPPTLSMAVKNQHLIQPMGVVINASIQQSRRAVEWDELNNPTPRPIYNKITTGLSLQRARINENSLNYSAYRWLIKLLLAGSNDPKVLTKGLTPFTTANGRKDKYEFNNYPGVYFTKSDGKNGTVPYQAKHYDNLLSELFYIPTGILAVEFDNFYNITTCQFFENCFISNHSKSLSENPLVVEAVNISCVKALAPFGINFKGIQKYIITYQKKIQSVVNELTDASVSFG